MRESFDVALMHMQENFGEIVEKGNFEKMAGKLKKKVKESFIKLSKNLSNF